MNNNATAWTIGIIIVLIIIIGGWWIYSGSGNTAAPNIPAASSTTGY